MKKILIVDDEEDITSTLYEALTEQSYQVLIANDGLEALRKTAIFKPDLILLDVLLPKMSGYDILKQLQETGGGFEQIPVIVMSKRDSMRNFFESWRIIEFLPKPFNQDDLLKKIADIFNTVSLEDQVEEAKHELKSASLTHPNDGQSVMLIGVQEFATERIKLSLESRHCRVYQAKEPNEILKVVKEHQPNVILCEFGGDPKILDTVTIYRTLQSDPMTKGIRFFIYCSQELLIDVQQTLPDISTLPYRDIHDLTEQLNSLPLNT